MAQAPTLKERDKVDAATSTSRDLEAIGESEEGTELELYLDQDKLASIAVCETHDGESPLGGAIPTHTDAPWSEPTPAPPEPRPVNPVGPIDFEDSTEMDFGWSEEQMKDALASPLAAGAPSSSAAHPAPSAVANRRVVPTGPLPRAASPIASGGASAAVTREPSTRPERPSAQLRDDHPTDQRTLAARIFFAAAVMMLVAVILLFVRNAMGAATT